MNIFTERADLNITSQGFMLRERKQAERRKNVPFNKSFHLTFSLKKWSSIKKQVKKIYWWCEKCSPFEGWWVFKTKCKIIYLKWRCLLANKDLCQILFTSVTWNGEFDKTLENFKCVSPAGCSLKASPALFDNEMENNISLRIRQLFAVQLTEECQIPWQLLPLRCS